MGLALIPEEGKTDSGPAKNPKIRNDLPFASARPPVAAPISPSNPNTTQRTPPPLRAGDIMDEAAPSSPSPVVLQPPPAQNIMTEEPEREKTKVDYEGTIEKTGLGKPGRRGWLPPPRPIDAGHVTCMPAKPRLQRVQPASTRETMQPTPQPAAASQPQPTPAASQPDL